MLFDLDVSKYFYASFDLSDPKINDILNKLLLMMTMKLINIFKCEGVLCCGLLKPDFHCEHLISFYSN